MSESTQRWRTAVSALAVGLALFATIAAVSSVGAATGDATSPSPVYETTDVLNETTDELENTTETVDDFDSDLDGSLTTDENLSATLNQTSDSLTGATLDETTELLNASVTTVDELSTTVDQVGGLVTPDGGDGSNENSADSNRAGGSTAHVPDRGDPVDAGLMGLLGGVTLLGGAATSGAGAGTGIGSSTGRVRERFARRLLRLTRKAASLSLNKLPLSLLRYSRYDDSDPLAHETRRGLYETIEAEPGQYLSALESSHQVSLSTIRHHLSVLEDEGLLETKKQHGKRRYYPAHTEDVELAGALNEPAKARVLGVLVECGDAHNGRIADALDVDPSTVSHHLSMLEEEGLVERRRDGRTIRNTLAPGVEAAYIARAEPTRGAATEPSSARGDD